MHFRSVERQALSLEAQSSTIEVTAGRTRIIGKPISVGWRKERGEHCLTIAGGKNVPLMRVPCSTIGSVTIRKRLPAEAPISL